MSWPKMSASGLVQCTGGYLGTGSSLSCTKKNIFLVENHKINIFQIIIDKKYFHEPIFHLLSYLKMSHHPNFCSSLVHNYERVSKGGHVVLSVKLFSFRKYPSTLFYGTSD